MKHLFIDETSDATNTSYLGVCGALIDTSKYGELKREYASIIDEYGWDPSLEFKGTMIFSQSQGCQDVLVDKRIQIAKAIIQLNASDNYSRIKFCYVSSNVGSDRSTYLKLAAIVIAKLLNTKVTPKNGKNIVSICCDNRSDVTLEELRAIAIPILDRRKLILFEDIILTRSSSQTVGICLADIVGYLMGRTEILGVGRENLTEIDPIQAQTNGQIRKLLASAEIVGMIKSIQVIPVVGTIDVDTFSKQHNLLTEKILAEQRR